MASQSRDVDGGDLDLKRSSNLPLPRPRNFGLANAPGRASTAKPRADVRISHAHLAAIDQVAARSEEPGEPPRKPART
eukprot:9446972-Alexandrium_andersonii.AAC.1